MSQHRARAHHKRKLRAGWKAALESLERRLCLAGTFDLGGDVELSEGDAGITNFNFSVTWNEPGRFNTFAQVTVSTLNGSAIAGFDYQWPQDLGITFEKPSGSTEPVTHTFSVPVIGDTSFEADEFFVVDLSDPIGATIANNGRAQGTILNDDALVGTAGNDVLSISATGPNSGTFTLNGGAPVPFAGINVFAFNTLGGDDLFQISSPDTALFAPPGGINYNGGGQADDRLANLGARFAAGTIGTYSVGATNGSAVLTHSHSGVTQTIRFSGLARVTDFVPGEFLVFANHDANNISVDGAMIAIDAFPISIGNKTRIEVSGFDGNDTFNITPAPFVTIDVHGNDPTPPSQPGDTLNVNTTGTATPILAFTATPAGFQGSYTFGNRRPVNFTQVETGPTAPRVVTTAFRNDTAPHLVSYTFSQDVSDSLTVNDFRIENLTTGTVLPPAQIHLARDPFARTAVFSFPGYPRGILPDGNWQATLLTAGITDYLGVALDGDADQNPGGNHVFNFFHLTADANRDRSIGFADLVLLAQNYNTTNKTFSTGDFDYDTDVDFADLVILAQRYGTSLPPAGAAAAEPVAAKAQAKRPPVFNDTTIRPTTRPDRRPQPSRKTR